jgi:hypothetical protein
MVTIVKVAAMQKAGKGRRVLLGSAIVEKYRKPDAVSYSYQRTGREP